MRTRTNRAAALIIATAACALPACQSSAPEPIGMAGGNALTASYSMGTMSTDVNRPGIGVREVASAAEAIFRRRGFTVRTVNVTGVKARVTAQEPGEGEFRATVVTAETTPGGVRISVRCEPFGDKDRSRVMMNDVLGRLGL